MRTFHPFRPFDIFRLPPSGLTAAQEFALIRAMFVGANGGYWAAGAGNFYEDSAGTIPASLNGVIGARANAISGQPNAIQATTANKPYLRRTQQTNLYWADSNTANSALTVTFSASLGSACTVARVGPEGVSFLENQTIGTTYNVAPAYGWNGDVMVINRALTVAEKAIVTRYMTRKKPQLGNERVSNWSFDAGLTGWRIVGVNATNTVTVMDESCRFLGDGTARLAIEQAGVLTSEKSWWTVVSVTLIAGALKTTTGSGATERYFTTSGTHRFVNTAAGQTTLEVIRMNSGQAIDALLHSISVQEII